MVKRAALTTLVRAVEVGLLVTATEGATKYDPFVRPLVRARVRRALRDAAAKTTVPPEDDGEAHHLRLAFLTLANQGATVAPDDVAAVAAAYGAAAPKYLPKKGRAFWPFTTAFGALLLAGALALVVVFFFPTPEERFRKTALAKALGDPLTSFIIAANRPDAIGSQEQQKKQLAILLGKDVRAQIGDEATDRIGDVLLHASTVATLEGDAVDEESKKLDSALDAANLALAKRHVPACVDAYVAQRMRGRATVWILGYYAKQQIEARVGAERATVFWGSRLDGLNFAAGGGAYQSDAERSIIISLDDIEGDVLRPILSAVGGRHVLAVGGFAMSGSAREALQKKVTERVTSEIVQGGAIDQSAAKEISELVDRRDGALGRLNWEGRGGRKMSLSRKWKDELKEMRGDAQAEQVLRLDGTLDMPDWIRAVARVVDVYASLEEEEFVGYVLAYRDDTLVVPEELRPIVGTSTAARSDLAARLGALARRRTYAFVELSRLADRALGASYATFATRAARGVFAVLAKELGVSSTSAPAPDRAPDADANESSFGDESLEKTMLEIFSKSPEDVRSAAERAYTRLYARPVPPFARRPL